MSILVTHDGKFHADDVYAVTTLCAWHEVHQRELPRVVRTRDDETIDHADIVVDVGKEYDPSRSRFDHHQGSIEPRENGVPFASFGLVWQTYGGDLCEHPVIAERVEERLVQPIDAGDNGMRPYIPTDGEIDIYDIADFIESFVPAWHEKHSHDERFTRACEIAREHLMRVIAHETGKFRARDMVEAAYRQAADKRIIVLEQRMPWKDVIRQYDEPRFVVYPVPGGNDEFRWHVQAVPVTERSFENRRDLPEAWRGMDRDALVRMTGIDDILFVHRGGFLAVTGSRASALQVAYQALDDETKPAYSASDE